MNLVVNAAESADGAVDVRIETKAIEVTENDIRELVPGSPLKPGHGVALDVTDNGSGMDAETLKRIFDPFFTTKSAGRGLGLAASLGIVHRHRGGIRVTSQPGEGTSSRIVFPASDQIVRPSVERPVSDLSGHGVILVVDDDDYILQAVYVALESYGYSVLLANSGAAAIQIFEEQSEQIDLVLLDMLMPGMSGEETFGALRADPPRCEGVAVYGFRARRSRTEIHRRRARGLSAQNPTTRTNSRARSSRSSSEEADSRRSRWTKHSAACAPPIARSYRTNSASSPRRLRASREADGSEAFLQAREIAHRLAGTAGSYGFGDLGAALGKIEDALREVSAEDVESARWSDIDATVAEIREHFPPGDKP